MSADKCSVCETKMDKTSLLKIFKGSRTLGATNPILIVVADTSQADLDGSVFSEYFLFHKFQELPFLYGREWYETPYAPDGSRVEFSSYPQLFGLEPMFHRQIETAMSELQTAVWKLDHAFHSELFYSDQKLEFREELGDTFLMRFKLLSQFTDDMRSMFAFTKSPELKNIDQKLAQVPEFICRHEP